MAILKVGSSEIYHTIAAAMAHASAGDTISLDNGYSNETTVVSVNNISVTGKPSSTNIDLTLGAGIGALTLQGTAPIFVHDNSGNNTITGNAGANTIEVSGGTDVVNGGGGNDRLIVDYSNATSTITGTVGGITDGGTNSVTFTNVRNETILTGSGNDTITAGDGSNIINTGIGNDTITSGTGTNVIQGGLGNDTITAGNDVAGNGVDHIYGDKGNDTITGGSGYNVLDGGSGNDTLNGGAGTSILFGDSGINILNGGTGISTADYLHSTLGVTVSLALATAQHVSAVQTDTLNSIQNLIGSNHDDSLTASVSGNNELTGGRGADRLIAGGGHDTFSYTSVQDSTSTTYDMITGFNTSLDKFQLWFAVNGIDTEIRSGNLSASTFDANLASAIGPHQLAAHDAVLFTPTFGTLKGDTFLIVDANGHAGYQAGQDLVIELAHGSHLLSFSAADFTV